MSDHLIKFSHDYPKLHGQTSGELLAVRDIRIDKNTPAELLEYDTAASDGSHYKLATGDYIQLIFLGDLRIPFCTIRSRRNRYAEDKGEYYRHLIGQVFDVVLKEG